MYLLPFYMTNCCLTVVCDIRLRCNRRTENITPSKKLKWEACGCFTRVPASCFEQRAVVQTRGESGIVGRAPGSHVFLTALLLLTALMMARIHKVFTGE